MNILDIDISDPTRDLDTVLNSPDDLVVIWSGKFLDGSLSLAIHPDISYSILFTIKSSHSDEEIIVTGKVKIDFLFTPADLPTVVEKVITQLTAEYLDVVQGVKNELIAEGSEQLH